MCNASERFSLNNRESEKQYLAVNELTSSFWEETGDTAFDESVGGLCNLLECLCLGSPKFEIIEKSVSNRRKRQLNSEDVDMTNVEQKRRARRRGSRQLSYQDVDMTKIEKRRECFAGGSDSCPPRTLT